MDGYGMVRNMIATNRANLSRVGQRRSKKFESFDTSVIAYPFPELNPVKQVPVPEAYREALLQDLACARKQAKVKHLIAGTIALAATLALASVFFQVS